MCVCVCGTVDVNPIQPYSTSINITDTLHENLCPFMIPYSDWSL